MEILKDLQEEIYCLNFELNAISNLLIRGEAERWVHKFIYYQYEQEHLNRYELVKKYVDNKKVLDIACGSGYGSYMLAKEGNAAEVIGCDLSPDSIRYAKHKYKNPQLEYFIADAEKYIRDSYFDVVVSFETIEHLNNYEVFLTNIQTSLSSDGLFFVSTPITRQTTTNCGNPYHNIEWSFSDFQNLVKKYFTIDTIYIQNPVFESSKDYFSRAYRKARRILSSNSTISNPSFDLQVIGLEKIYRKIISGYQILICRRK
jgi:2-polyprenyl-3-methyl-5-hydroxy-6-metoxy-1,4-benzoquinol methylase